MTSIVIAIVSAGALGLIGAVLGVRNLKRQTNITIERGVPQRFSPVDQAWEDLSR